MRMKSSVPSQTVATGTSLDTENTRAIITSEEIASAERALKQLASVTNDPKAADSLRQLASAVRPVSHWGLNE